MTATAAQLKLMGKAILDFEARRDARGHLAVYDLPSGDGGGRYEVAGINERYNPDELGVLVRLLKAHKWDMSEAYAINFYIKDTDVVATWGDLDSGVEFYLRDSVFNRGAKGAARILQRALGIDTDGQVGIITKNALAVADPKELLIKLRTAREWYERMYAHRDEDSKFWKGLVNRWNNALARAKEFQI